MSIATRIQGKLDKTLKRLNITDRVVIKRISTPAGGDALLGRYASVSNADTVLDPQPAISPFSKDYALVVADAALTPNGQYVAITSASALSRTDVENPNLSILFRDSQNNDEVLYIEAFTPYTVNGVDVGFNLILGSKHR